MIEKRVIEELVNGYLERTNYFLVEVKVSPENDITVEIDSDDAASIDDCATLSRFIESKLDRNSEDYSLEVGSAGIASPLRCLRQYRKYIDKEVEILTRDGRKLTGLLKSADDDQITITVEKTIKPEGAKRKIKTQEDLTLNYNEIKKANYLIRFK